jgi:hypothetical protein
VWPSDEDIAVLVKKSSGLFIFASTVVRFIESEHHEPGERLQLIVSKADDTSHEGASGIDSLYSQVLRDAFSGIKEESVFVDLKRILSAVVLALNPLSEMGWCNSSTSILRSISTRLRHLHSVILVPAPGRRKFVFSTNHFRISCKIPIDVEISGFTSIAQTRHGEMVLSCLGLVGKLKMNPCGLPPFVMNQDVPDRPELMRQTWEWVALRMQVLVDTFSSLLTIWEYDNRLIASISRFFDHTVFPWMEVMSLEGQLEGVIHSMNHLLDWLYKVSGTHYGQYP